MLINRGIEISAQSIPETPENLEPLANSVPLFDLADVAPRVPRRMFESKEPEYPFSDDEAIPYFDQVQSRTLTPEYRAATNRTAVLIGESSLTAVLPYITEDTIVLLDNSPSMVNYMRQYVEALKTSETPNEWANKVVKDDYEVERLFNQTMQALFDGYEHPIYRASEEVTSAYFAARQALKHKAVIPWRGDLTSAADMQRLGDALKERNANVTLMNLSNVPIHGLRFASGRAVADALRPLPVVANAPILTTTTTLRPPVSAEELSYRTTKRFGLKEATGPFFGLDNLAEHGGLVDPRNPGAIAVRRYAPLQTIENGMDVEELITQVIERVGGSACGNVVIEFVVASPEELPPEVARAMGLL